MNEIKEGIRYIFQTKNELTLAISASGHTGLEAIFSNILEANDKVLICCNGIWGMRALTMAKKLGNYSFEIWWCVNAFSFLNATMYMLFRFIFLLHIPKQLL